MQERGKDQHPITAKVYEPCSVKKGLKVFSKHIGPCQPAQSVQRDMGQIFWLSLNYLRVEG